MHVFIYLFIYCDRRMRGQQLRFMRSFLLLLKAEGREKSRRLSVAVSQMPQKVQPFYYLLLCVAQIYRMINLGTCSIHDLKSEMQKWLSWHSEENHCLVPSEEAAADEKKGKLYKPKSRFETQTTKSFLPLETPPQFLALDKRHVSTFTVNKSPIFLYL